jgi:hypothetical protein
MPDIADTGGCAQTQLACMLSGGLSSDGRYYGYELSTTSRIGNRGHITGTVENGFPQNFSSPLIDSVETSVCISGK